VNVLLFGATGMVGQGVLRECLNDPGVDSVRTVGRRATGGRHDRVTDLVVQDLYNLEAVEPRLTGFDACGRAMWARVKGRTANALLRLPFRATYIFRPGLIQPLHGIRSRTRAYRIIYASIAPVYPLLKSLFPNSITSTELLGRAMISVARRGYSKAILDPRDINSAGQIDRPAV
jgi:uncharacterized protein YbjT (DUF2867 family)